MHPVRRIESTSPSRYLLPAKITTWSHDLPYLHGLGCVGISLESFNTWELYAPHLYLSIRLSYDPRQDPWEIMADYWDKAYGPAAETMAKYWMAVDAAFVNLKTETGSTHALHHVYTPERLRTLDGWVRDAEKLVGSGTDNQQYRVDDKPQRHQPTGLRRIPLHGDHRERHGKHRPQGGLHQGPDEQSLTARRAYPRRH